MDTVTLFRDSLMLVVLLSAPALIVTTVIGVIVSLVQGLFQIQDQALAYTVKVIALVAILILSGQWMNNEVVSLSERVFILIGRVR
jgi:type III secretion protein S